MAKDLHQRFGKHKLAYYQREILQFSRLKSLKCTFSHWSIYQWAEIKCMNANVPTGKRHKVVTKLSPLITANWTKLSEAEKVAATNPLTEAFNDAHEDKVFSPHNVMLSSFQDTNKTLKSIQTEFQRLHAWTSNLIIMIVCCGNVSQYNQPVAFRTPQAKDFIDLAFGLAKTKGKLMAEKKTAVGQLIYAKLVAAPFKSPCMYYVNFNDHITAKYGIIVEHWPLSQFCSPTEFSANHDLITLHNLWPADTTFFQKMSDQEFEQWETECTTKHQQQATKTVTEPITTPSVLPSSNISGMDVNNTLAQ
ncbi:hypothetical protein CONPUDRAFT_154835 [Coniophora puteana RWD-64-598 SS2]|uniref:Uncharacterized protein n=1 Tax=Coniophora puteana (strain RWD-64-598) TaxID=741705 RepID=A0A5M3MQ89_CONPW|nr:uncharacterized protein CONPUDRAFT_154835 [Coniophora puteana RWD-64-598 SS2]EIW80845.1 hypothetical protein CONPUDRAFT_154835 [Coniophora puteana RWD-64-598 SS2]